MLHFLLNLSNKYILSAHSSATSVMNRVNPLKPSMLKHELHNSFTFRLFAFIPILSNKAISHNFVTSKFRTPIYMDKLSEALKFTISRLLLFFYYVYLLLNILQLFSVDHFGITYLIYFFHRNFFFTLSA